jgi:hypothetical protein
LANNTDNDDAVPPRCVTPGGAMGRAPVGKRHGHEASSYAESKNLWVVGLAILVTAEVSENGVYRPLSLLSGAETSVRAW